MEKFKKYVDYVILFFVFVVYFKSCGVSNDLEDHAEVTQATMDSLHVKIDRLQSEIDNNVINEEEMVKLLKNTVMWRTLRIEEISDKERISINALEAREEDL